MNVSFPENYVPKSNDNLLGKDDVKNKDIKAINESLNQTLEQYAYLWDHHDQTNFVSKNRAVVSNWDMVNNSRMEESKIITLRKSSDVNYRKA